jgi:[ribosomal protein S5]-alanine N-acetyltransferase
MVYVLKNKKFRFFTAVQTFIFSQRKARFFVTELAKHSLFKMIHLTKLETERTFLRQLEETDASEFYALNLDPDVIKYTGDRAFLNIEEACVFLKSYDQYTKYGVGRFAVIEKSTHNFMGWCGLRYTPETHEYDIGFRFHKTYWNKGYATETAKACLEYGFKTLLLHEIIGRAMTENTASIKVLEKLGMHFRQNRNCGGEDGVVMVITKEDYEKNK